MRGVFDRFGVGIIDLYQITALRCNREHQLISIKKPVFGLPRCCETMVRVDLNQQLLYKFAPTIVAFVRNPCVQPAIFDQRLEVDVEQPLPRARRIVLNKGVQRYDAEQRSFVPHCERSDEAVCLWR